MNYNIINSNNNTNNDDEDDNNNNNLLSIQLSFMTQMQNIKLA